jgi:hypothetical protein
VKTIFLFLVMSTAASASGLVLKPLNPIPVADDAFNVSIDPERDAYIPEWVKLADVLRQYRFLDTVAGFRLAPVYRSEIRLFLVDSKASFKDIVSEIGKLKALGFRPTSLRHLLLLANGENMRLLEPGVAVISSEPPVARIGLVETQFEGALFVASILKDKKIEIGLIGEPTLRTFKACVVIFEPPP